MSGFLGINVKYRRVKRFWSAVGAFFGGALSVLFGHSSQPDMSAYTEQLSQLKAGQVELLNKMNLQTTVFMADAEKKKIQIEWLQKTQGDIQNKLLSLETDMSKDSEEKAKQIKELNVMLEDTRKKLDEQEKKQEKLTQQVEMIEKKLLGVDEKLKDLVEIVSSQGKTLNETILKVELNTLTIDYNFLFDQFEEEQKKLFYVVKRARRGELDPYVLSPLDLIEMLQNIIPNMQDNEKFPYYPNIENARHLYSLITPDVFFSNYTLVFILKMPLVNIKSFDLYKLTSLPLPVSKNVFAFILPKNPFLLVDKIYQEYLTLNFEEFKDFCKGLNDNKFLCKQTQHLYSVVSDSRCEISLLMTSRTIPDNCDKRLMYLKDILFIQLQKLNSWIFSATQLNVPVFISCDSERHSVILEGSGFMSLSNNCKLRYNQYGIESLLEYSNPVESNYTSSLNLSNFIPISDVENMQSKTEIKQRNLILPFSMKDLAEMSVSVESYKSHMSFLYFLLLIPIAVFIIIIVIKRSYLKKSLLMCRNRFNTVRSEGLRRSVGFRNEGETKDKLNAKIINGKVKIEATSSDDPDSEYLTVRVKVKNNEISKNNRVGKDCSDKKNTQNVNHYQPSVPNVNLADTEDDDIYGNSNVAVEHNYLTELRKIKPKM